jgi:NADH dehydrogenase
VIELLDLIGAAVGRSRVRRAHVPLGVMRVLAHLFHRLPAFPVTPDQLAMLGENSTCDPHPFFTTFGREPVPLAAGLARMLG